MKGAFAHHVPPRMPDWYFQLYPEAAQGGSWHDNLPKGNPDIDPGGLVHPDQISPMPSLDQNHIPPDAFMDSQIGYQNHLADEFQRRLDNLRRPR